MLLEQIQKSQKRLSANKCIRQRIITERLPGQDNRLRRQNKVFIDFASNDYLGLQNLPSTSRPLATGSAASADLTGYHRQQQQLEQAFADWLGVERCLLFSSGYLANLGVISSLLSRQHQVLSDKACHASILDGIQLSRAQSHRFKHQDLNHAATLAEKQPPQLIISEALFSMSGIKTETGKLATLAAKHQAALLIDEAHSIGVYGDTGQGSCAKQYKDYPHTLISAALGKAFNTQGAIVAGSDLLIEHITQHARTARYTTALSPHSCDVLLAKLAIIQREHWRRTRLQENITLFRRYAQRYQLPLIAAKTSPIQPVVFGSNSKLLAGSHQIQARGFFAAAIRPPTVAQGQACLRISLNSLHTAQEIKGLINAVAKAYHAK
jgi:8-amino-7-oxononanoate synthase